MKNNPQSHGKIRQLIHTGGRSLFPISWLQKQDYCEYQIYLENVRGIKAEPTQAMAQGQQEHKALYDRFAEEAKPATVEEMLVESKKAAVLSREFKVLDIDHGLYGYIDEIWMTPDNFVVIDDKPGTKSYSSSINQVFGYCLAFKSTSPDGDRRKVIAALRERGTENIFWQSPFGKTEEEATITLVNRIHSLLVGKEEFLRTDNPNKCRVCRLKEACGIDQ